MSLKCSNNFYDDLFFSFFFLNKQVFLSFINFLKQWNEGKMSRWYYICILELLSIFTIILLFLCVYLKTWKRTQRMWSIFPPRHIRSIYTRAVVEGVWENLFPGWCFIRKRPWETESLYNSSLAAGWPLSLDYSCPLVGWVSFITQFAEIYNSQDKVPGSYQVLHSRPFNRFLFFSSPSLLFYYFSVWNNPK